MRNPRAVTPARPERGRLWHVSRERAGVIVLHQRQLALIERRRAELHYWVIPGGGVEAGEDAAAAALREAQEELGVSVELGRLLLRIDHRTASGVMERQSYFEATITDPRIEVAGPETTHGADRGSYSAVWRPLDRLDPSVTFPSAVAAWVLKHRGKWPDGVDEIIER
jgi:8-oxo-dGTP diphosphatase